MNAEALDRRLLDQIERMQRALADSGYGDLGMWNELCAKHVKLLREHGFANFKRTINFEYHQWSVRSFLDVKSLQLGLSLLRRARLPHAALRARMDVDDALDTHWTKGRITRQRLLAYRMYTGLLWDLALAEDRLGVLSSLEEPSFGRPLKIRYNDKLIAQDLALSVLELNDIAQCCDLGRVRRVAEIGAGYGRFAWVALRTQPQLSYHVFDIPPALGVSEFYLTECLGKESIVSWSDSGASMNVPSDEPGKAYFHLPLKLEQVPDHAFDLVVNISSFDEMPPAEVEKYFSWIDRTLKGTLYLKGYRYNPASGWSYKRFPYPARWKRIWSGVDPANPLFIRQAFSVNV